MGELIYWGVFACFGLILIGYLVWMAIAEGRDPASRPADPDTVPPPPASPPDSAPAAPPASDEPTRTFWKGTS